MFGEENGGTGWGEAQSAGVDITTRHQNITCKQTLCFSLPSNRASPTVTHSSGLISVTQTLSAHENFHAQTLSLIHSLTHSLSFVSLSLSLSLSPPHTHCRTHIQTPHEQKHRHTQTNTQTYHPLLVRLLLPNKTSKCLNRRVIFFIKCFIMRTGEMGRGILESTV